MAIRCWRAMLCLVRYRETDFTRTLESFVPTTSTVIAEFDASLQGAGVVWYSTINRAEKAGGVAAVDLSFLNFGDDFSFSESLGVYWIHYSGCRPSDNGEATSVNELERRQCCSPILYVQYLRTV